MKVTLISNYLDDTAVANFARKSFNDDAAKYTDAQLHLKEMVYENCFNCK